MEGAGIRQSVRHPAGPAELETSMKITIGTSLLFLTLSAAACGPSPRYRVDNVVLSDVPVSRKGDTLAAEAEMNYATEEKRKAEADVALDGHDISVAEAEYAQVKWNRNKAEADLQLAERGKDLNRIEPAKAQLRGGDMGRRAGEAKLNWLKARHDYHRSMIEVSGLHWTAAQRRYELEKARLVQATDKRPSKDFSVARFEQQAAVAQGRYDQAGAQAERQRSNASQLEQTYAQIAPPSLP
jgi:hypothetical protein